MAVENVLHEVTTKHGQYRVVDTTYSGRPARVLYSGDYSAAQSGVAFDDNTDLLFDYNQRFMELVAGMEPARLLIIGGGTFTLPKAVMDDYPDMHIDIVEIDSELLTIARDYFEFKPTDQVQVHIGDGREYIDTTNKKYDLIIVDAFSHAEVPRVFQTIEAAKSFARCLTPGGVLAINVIAAYYGRRSALLRRLVAATQTQVSHISIFQAGNGTSAWIPQNYLLVGQQSDADLAQYLRSKEMEPVLVDADEAVHDE